MRRSNNNDDDNITMDKNKSLTELIVEAKRKGTLDRISLPGPYIWLIDKEFGRVAQAVNIVAREKGYRVVNFHFRPKFVIVLMEKKE